MTNKWFLKGLLTLLVVVYPFLVYFGVQYFNLKTLAIILSVVFLIRYKFINFDSFITKYIAGVFVLTVLFNLMAVALDDLFWLKLYPVILNLGLFCAFLHSLFTSQPMIERVARMQESDLPDYAVPYTRKVTYVWMVFFIVNACISLWTATLASHETWLLYNGLISYIATGVLFTLEWIVRFFYKQKMEKLA